MGNVDLSLVRLIPREELSEHQRAELEKIATEHAQELPGLLNDWSTQNSHVHAVFDAAIETFVGIVTWSGMLSWALPAWWIHRKGCGYGGRAVDLMAADMKRHGITGISDIKIQTLDNKYDEVSARLRDRLLALFPPRPPVASQEANVSPPQRFTERFRPRLKRS